MNNVLRDLELTGIIPVVAIDDVERAEPLGEALVEGGLPCVEITFRTSAAAGAMTRIAKRYPEMLIGAGTVLTVEQVKTAIRSGAKFIVSPGLNPRVVEYCVANDIPVTPGVATPSEIERAIEFGLSVVKFFPAEANGGLPFLKAMSAPYKQMRFIPTGGIDESNLAAYLHFTPVMACGGSWMVKPELINAGNFDEIKRLTERAVQLMLGFELRHVGINCSSSEESLAGARLAESIFSFPVREGSSSNFAGTGIEFLKSPYLGRLGHIAIGTRSIDRAAAYLERKGFRMQTDTRVEKKGKVIALYLEKDLAGFAVHLLQL